MGLIDALVTTFKTALHDLFAGMVAFNLGFTIVTLNIPPYVTVLLGGTEGDTAITSVLSWIALLTFPGECFQWPESGDVFSLTFLFLFLPGIYFWKTALRVGPAHLYI